MIVPLYSNRFGVSVGEVGIGTVLEPCRSRTSRKLPAGQHATLRHMGQMRALADRLEAAATALTEMGPAVAAREPWPLTASYGPGPESEWGPREVLAHVAEMLPYWIGEIELIVDAGIDAAAVEAGMQAPGFGRLEDDPIRIQIIGRDRGFPGRELLDRIDVEGRRVARRFRALDGAESTSLGRHLTRGDLSIADIAERLIVGHIEGHVTQLRELVAAR